ncbi:hypothetical protein ACLOJK_033399 [Asimina triloba]
MIIQIEPKVHLFQCSTSAPYLCTSSSPKKENLAAHLLCSRRHHATPPSAVLQPIRAAHRNHTTSPKLTTSSKYRIINSGHLNHRKTGAVAFFSISGEKKPSRCCSSSPVQNPPVAAVRNHRQSAQPAAAAVFILRSGEKTHREAAPNHSRLPHAAAVMEIFSKLGRKNICRCRGTLLITISAKSTGGTSRCRQPPWPASFFYRAHQMFTNHQSWSSNLHCKMLHIIQPSDSSCAFTVSHHAIVF